MKTRRHHNNDGRRQIKRGKTRNQVAHIARRLGLSANQGGLLGVQCPGCWAELTLENAGGYHCFCRKCVEAMPPFPTDGRGYTIEGKYPDFQWVTDEET